MDMTDILIRNCDVLQIKNHKAEILVGQDISVSGKNITAIAPTSSEIPQDVHKIIEAGHKLAIPGLINTHAHVPMVLFRGLAEDISVVSWFNDYIFPLESNLTPEDVYWGAMLGIAEMIEGGVLHVADHYFAMDEVAQAVSDSGIRANLSWAVFGHEGETKLDQTCEFIERWQGKADGRITTWLGPHAPYTTGPDFLKLSAQKAKKLGVGVHIHVSETAEQVQMSLDQYGMTPVKMLEETGILESPTLLAHCAHPTEEDLKLLTGKRVGVAHAPKTYMKLGSGVAPALKFRAAGIPLGLATDGAASSNTLDILEQLRIMVLAQKNITGDPTQMPVAEALEIAFQGGADVLQMSDRLGALEPGKLADIVLVRQGWAACFPTPRPGGQPGLFITNIGCGHGDL